MSKTEAPAWPAVAILAAIAVAGAARCERPGHRWRAEDACGARMRPVTVGGAMVVGCRRDVERK